jgi:hypothetical protein
VILVAKLMVRWEKPEKDASVARASRNDLNELMGWVVVSGCRFFGVAFLDGSFSALRGRPMPLRVQGYSRFAGFGNRFGANTIEALKI